jgi:putative hydrolase of the HAD superfamily
VPDRAVLLDLDNTLLLEDDSTFAALRQACDVGRERAGVDPEALCAAIVQSAQELWQMSSIYRYAEAMGIWWGEGLWGDFSGDASGLADIRSFVSGFRAGAWRVALGAVGVTDDRLAGELADAYRTARRTGQLVDPDAEPVVADLARDHVLALVTNGAPGVQRAKLATTSLAPRFKAIVISAEVGIGKPEPGIFQIALETLRAGADDAVMVGDSLGRDVAGARRAGIRAIHLDRGSHETLAGPPPVPDAVIRSLRELRPALAALAPDGASPRGSREPHPA